MNINKDNFFVIQAFMVSDLKLSGNELLVYSIIYGFTQDGKSEFKGSLDYLGSWTNSTRPTVIKALDSLVKKELITKVQVLQNNVKFNKFKVVLGKKNGSKESLPVGSKEILPLVKNTSEGGKESLPEGSKESLHNNIFLKDITKDSASEEQKKKEDKFKGFQKWIEENAPNVAKLKSPFTLEEYLKLKEKFTFDQISEMLMTMHNYKPLLQKNISANLTFLKWTAKEYNITTTSPPPKARNFKQELVDESERKLMEELSKYGV